MNSQVDADDSDETVKQSMLIADIEKDLAELDDLFNDIQ